jgi:hypothetical protein
MPNFEYFLGEIKLNIGAGQWCHRKRSICIFSLSTVLTTPHFLTQSAYKFFWLL